MWCGLIVKSTGMVERFSERSQTRKISSHSFMCASLEFVEDYVSPSNMQVSAILDTFCHSIRLKTRTYFMNADGIDSCSWKEIFANT